MSRTLPIQMRKALLPESVNLIPSACVGSVFRDSLSDKTPDASAFPCCFVAIPLVVERSAGTPTPKVNTRQSL